MASGPWSLFRSEPEKKDKRAPLLNIESFDDDENPSDCAACEPLRARRGRPLTGPEAAPLPPQKSLLAAGAKTATVAPLLT